MQIPNLPTDNLYKFMALLGLILIILSTVFPIWTIHYIGLKQIQSQTELDLFDIEEVYLRREQQEIRETLEALPPNKRIGARRLTDEKARDHSIKFGQTKGKWEEIKYLNSWRKDLKVFIFTGMFIGSILTVYGFSLWYKRLQKYQDQVIKNEAQKQLHNNSERK